MEKKPTQVSQAQLTRMIQEEVARIQNKFQQKSALLSRKAEIEKELKALNECYMEDEGEEKPMKEAFTADQILAPGAAQPMNEDLGPDTMNALTTAINWLTSSSPSLHGSMPNAALLAGPALAALSGAIVAAQSLLKKKQQAGQTKPPVQK